MASKDFYAILGVTKNASEAEIKQAYRKLSKELHPDKHPSTGSGQAKKDAEAKFKAVNEAYEVLSDPKKKAAYDRFGSADYAGMGGGGSGGFEGFDPSQFQNMGGFGDIFESFFGGQGGGARRAEHQNHGRTVEIEMSIPFAESVTGARKTVTFQTLITCDECSGKGAEKGSELKTCTDCNGTGSVTKQMRSLFGVIRQSVVCDTCRGAGKVPEKACKKCSGEGRRSEKKTITVNVPAGIDDGQSLRLQGEGEAGRNGAAAGDLLVRIRVAEDARFERDGDDIRSTLSVGVVDATLGAEKTIDTVHGPTNINIPAGTQPSQILRLKGKGMPLVNTSRHGDHYVTIDVVIPTKLSKEERKLFEELRGKE